MARAQRTIRLRNLLFSVVFAILSLALLRFAWLANSAGQSAGWLALAEPNQLTSWLTSLSEMDLVTLTTLRIALVSQAP